MDFSFTEEQTLLRNSVSKFLADNYKFEEFKKISRSEKGWKPENWKQFAELGLLAAPLPEEHGGLGGSAVDTMVIMEEFGKALVVEPFVQTVVVGGGFVKHGGSDAQKSEWLGKIAGGETVIAFAFAEPQQLCAERAKGRGAGRAVGRHAHRHRAHRWRPTR
jgi:alkylation response protein AidB-like acyl-CoA dehydrogenase